MSGGEEGIEVERDSEMHFGVGVPVSETKQDTQVVVGLVVVRIETKGVAVGGFGFLILVGVAERHAEDAEGGGMFFEGAGAGEVIHGGGVVVLVDGEEGEGDECFRGAAVDCQGAREGVLGIVGEAEFFGATAEAEEGVAGGMGRGDLPPEGECASKVALVFEEIGLVEEVLRDEYPCRLRGGTGVNFATPGLRRGLVGCRIRSAPGGADRGGH